MRIVCPFASHCVLSDLHDLCRETVFMVGYLGDGLEGGQVWSKLVLLINRLVCWVTPCTLLLDWDGSLRQAGFQEMGVG